MPDESSEEEEEEEDKLEEEEDEADGGFRLGARERALSPGLEESGLGLLARFAASALPSPTVGPPLSVVQLEAKQKARKKEERQSLMGKFGQVCHLRRLHCPSLQVKGQAQRRVGAELEPEEPHLMGLPCPEQRAGDVAPACCSQGEVSKAMHSDPSPSGSQCLAVLGSREASDLHPGLGGCGRSLTQLGESGRPLLTHERDMGAGRAQRTRGVDRGASHAERTAWGWVGVVGAASLLPSLTIPLLTA